MLRDNMILESIEVTRMKGAEWTDGRNILSLMQKRFTNSEW